MKNSLIIAIIALAFMNCNRSSNSVQTIKNIETQFFEIPIGEATTITTKGGVIIEIQENTFESNASTIQLEVQEILTRADLIRSGVSTITKKGELLETGGMVNITTTSDAKINPNAPIKVKVPSKGLDTEMKLYEAVQKDGKIIWSLKSDLENQPYFDRIAAGKQLFQEKCAACHDITLSKNTTGPKLGNVTAHYSREWLYEFTRNSQQMIASGDSLALCQWAAWSPTVMSSFEDLTDDELKNIYDFIENETLLRGLDTIKTVDCDEVIRLGKIRQRLRNERQRIADSTWNAFQDSLVSEEVIRTDTFISDINYNYAITNFDFMNIDKLVNQIEDNQVKEVQPFIIKTNTKAGRVFMIFKHRNVYTEFYREINNWYLVFARKDKPILLPYNEPIKIVAISIDKKQVGIIETTIQDTNEHTIKLEPLKGSLDDFIESL